MAEIIWADPALADLEAIADYIALENPAAARHLVEGVLAAVQALRKFPRMGSVPPELVGLPYRQLIVSPCRIFYRIGKRKIYIVHVMRGEQSVRKDSFASLPVEMGISRKRRRDLRRRNLL